LDGIKHDDITGTEFNTVERLVGCSDIFEPLLPGSVEYGLRFGAGSSARPPQVSNPYEINLSMAMPIRYPTDVLKPGGVFIFAGICDTPPSEGTASHEFLKLMRGFCEADEIIGEVERVRDKAVEPALTNFLLETRAYGTALTLKLPGLTRDMHYTPVSTVEKALGRATEIIGRDSDIPRTRGSVAYVEDQREFN
jgi:hypothetical protein